MNIWNLNAQQRQTYHNWVELCYILSVSKKLSYLLATIMLLSQYKITIIFTVHFEMNNIAYTVKDSFEGRSNSKNELNYTTW